MTKDKMGFHKYSIYEKTLSVTTDKYLDSHRFGTIPYFPFVMGMEFFCQVCKDLKKIPDDILFSNFKMKNPITLRRDKPKLIKIKVEESLSKEEGKGDVFRIKIMDELLETVHIEGEVCFKKFSRKIVREPISIIDIPAQPERVIASDILYRDFFPHGPHFQTSFEIYRLNENEGLARLYNFHKDLQYVGEEKLEGLILNPVLLDGVLQLCTLYSIQYDKCFLLPISLDSCFMDLRLKKDVKDVYVRVKRLSSTKFDALIYSVKDQTLVLELRNITFAKLNRQVPDYRY